jgi:hypothetical protein
MNDEVYVERPPTRCRYGRLKRIVQGAPPVHCSTRKNPSAFQDSESVAVHRKHLPPEAVQKNAPRCFPRETRETRQESLGGLVAHCSREVQRQFARHDPHFGEQTPNRMRLLPVEPARTKHPGDLAHRGALESIPGGVSRPQLRPSRAEAR